MDYYTTLRRETVKSARFDPLIFLYARFDAAWLLVSFLFLIGPSIVQVVVSIVKDFS